MEKSAKGRAAAKRAAGRRGAVVRLQRDSALKKPLTDQDLLMLALVRLNLGTAYDLKAKAGISVGSSLPVLQRLHRAGLLHLGATDARGTHRYAITAKGTQVLETQWVAWVRKRPTEVNAILRTAALVLVMGDHGQVAEFYKGAAHTLETMANAKRAQAAQLAGMLGEPGGVRCRWLRSTCDVAMLEALSGALREIPGKIRSR